MSTARLSRYWPLALSMIVVAGALLLSAMTLPNSSLWLDELMSVYYSDPVHARAGELWAVMLTDLHPPGYYVVLYAWREIFGSSIESMRASSLVIMSALLLIYGVDVSRRFAPWIAAVSVAVVAASHVFIVYSQEVRGYPLLMLIALGAAMLYERLCRAEIAFRPALIAIALLAFLTETIHPYGVLFAGSLCGGLLLFRRALAERIQIVIAGVLLLVYPAARIAFMAELADDNYNWFEFLNPVVELLFGLARPIFVLEDLWIAVAMMLALGWWMLRGDFDFGRARRALPLLVLVPLVVAMALAVHYGVRASFNDRNLLMIAPAIWLLLPHMIDSVRATRVNKAVLAAGVTLLCLNHAWHSSWLFRGFKSEWRASAAFVDQYADACAGYPIPAADFMTPERDSYFYSWYLNNEFQFRFIERPGLKSVLEEAASSPCPIKFWSPHGLSPTDVASAEELAAMGLSVAVFEHAAQWRDTNLPGAWVIYDDSP